MAAGRYSGRHRFGQPGLIWCHAHEASTHEVKAAHSRLGEWIRSFFDRRQGAPAPTPLRVRSTVAHSAAAHAAATVRLGRAA